MLHRAFTFSATAASLIITLGCTASAGVLGSTSSQGQHDWVGAYAGAAAVSSVYPGNGFSALERSAGAGGVEQNAPAAGARPTLTAQTTPGAIALSARRHDGAEAIDVTGTAPPGATVEIEASARLSVDLPIVFLNRIYAVADANGAFSVILPIAPDYVQGTEILIRAETPGTTPGIASIIVGPPTSGPPITDTDVDNDRGP